MSKKIIGVTLAGLGIAGSFAGGMVLSNHIKDDNYTIVLAEKEEDIASISATLDNLDKQIAEKDAQISLLKTAQAELQTKYDNLVATNSATEEELANLQAQYDELVASNSATQEELDALQTQYNELKATSDADKAEIERLNSNIEELETTIASLESQLAESTEKYNELQESYTQLQEEYDALLAQSEVDKQEIDSLNASITDLNNQIVDLQQQVTELEEQLNSDKNFENLSNAVPDFESSQIIKISSTRFLIASKGFVGDSFTKLYSLKTDGSCNLVATSGASSVGFYFSLDFSAVGGFSVLSNGDVLLGDRSSSGGIYVYKYEEDSLALVTSSNVTPVNVIEVDNDRVIVSGNIINSGVTLSVNLSDYSYEVNKDFACLKYVGRSNKNVLLEGYLVSDQSRVFVFYDSETNTFEQLEGTPVPNSYGDNTYEYDDGDILFSSAGSGSLSYFKAQDKSITLIDSNVCGIQDFREFSNNVLIFAHTYASSYKGLCAYNKDTGKYSYISSISSLQNYDTFEEDENGVTISSSKNSYLSKYYYSFESGEFSKL